MHSEMGQVRPNSIQRTIRTAHLSVLMTVHSFSTQYSLRFFQTIFENTPLWRLKRLVTLSTCIR